MNRCMAWVLSGFVLLALGVGTATALTDDLNWDAGFDLRLRQEIFDHIPISADPPGITRGGRNNYFRVRSRIWGGVGSPGSWTLMGRLANEFRHYETGADSSWDFPILAGPLAHVTGADASRDRLFGHVLAEVLDPGDYYNVSDLAYFLRWEVTYAF